MVNLLNNMSGCVASGSKLLNDIAEQQPLGGDELNQIGYRRVSILISVGVGDLTTCACHGGEVAKLSHLCHLWKQGPETCNSLLSSCLDSQRGDGHGSPLKNKGLPILHGA